MSKSRKKKKTSLLTSVLGMGGMLGLAFAFGVGQGLLSPPEKRVWITENLGYSPLEDPVINGLFVAGNILLFVLATMVGYALVGYLIVVLGRSNDEEASKK